MNTHAQPKKVDYGIIQAQITMTKYSPSVYDPFAWIYNRHWGKSFLPIILPVMENLVLRNIPQSASIMDLCCGTGQLAANLSAMGKKVTGVDGSPSMLKFARKNAPGVNFINADACDFTSAFKNDGTKLPQFHAVVSAFDSLNHVMTLSGLSSVFANVYQVLRSEGYFLLDLNTEAGYLYEWAGDFTIVEDDHVCVVQNTYSPSKRIATFDATIFRWQKGGWYRSDITLYQKYHNPDRVVSLLKSAGFQDIEVYGFNLEDGIRPLSKEMRRAFFVCRKIARTGN
jgi:SAM-dependent methyltransferase